MSRNNNSYNLWDSPNYYSPRKIRKKRGYNKTRYSKKARWNYNKRQSQTIDPIIAGGLLISWTIYFIYSKFIEPNIEAINYYSKYILVALLLFSFWLIYLKYSQKKKERLSIIAEKKRKEESMPKMLLELETKIREFVPSRHYSKEEPYQAELIGHLKNFYPTIKYEEPRNFVRTDLAIDNIAIEIKWPTNMNDLKTIPHKIIKYLKNWDYLIIVLFNVQITNDKVKSDFLFNEWKDEIYESFEIKKDKIIIINI